MAAPRKRVPWPLQALLWLGLAASAAADVSRPGGAGHALLFRDHGVLIENFQDLASNAFTFEAWLSTTDHCHSSAIFSYAARSPPDANQHQRTADANHFVIFDPAQLVACHDFEYIDLWPDFGSSSCMAAFNHSDKLPSFVTRNGAWHHLAVTWDGTKDGLTQVYRDGLLMASAVTHKTRPLQRGGALMLGSEQDCYGGCGDRSQSYRGLMDEVRLWRTARSQAEILAHMRDGSGLENHPDLAAYWQFNDPEANGLLRETVQARDSSGRGNHLPLAVLPTARLHTIRKEGKQLETGALAFHNNFAMNQGWSGMPDKDLTIEFWARTPAFFTRNGTAEVNSEFVSFATFLQDGDPLAPTVFLDDAILVEKYMKEYRGSHLLNYESFSTRGALSVHINANRQGNGARHDHWLDFDTRWVDDAWHHVAVTWAWDSGEVRLYLDGKPQTPFWASRAGQTEVRAPSRGGVDPHIAARSTRAANGSLVLGQSQDCYGGCFSPEDSLRGELANLRVWNRVLSGEEVYRGMFEAEPSRSQGLVAQYSFQPDKLVRDGDKQTRIKGDGPAGAANQLYLGADAPSWVYSTAPLAQPDGAPVAPPTPGAAGHAMFLSDQQVLILKDFQDFPSEELTLEFWMMSTDTCRKGVPFSYAAGGSTYAKSDNSFLLFNYNSWGVSVMEDEGTLADHLSGVGSTDGRWHHVAVTWRSSDGRVKLYDNGREMWSVERGRGKSIPSGGTLVVGREQDCEGGCFDSAPGAAGDTQTGWEQEYGAQDFFGLIDEMRLWRRARSQQEIQDGMRGSLFQRGVTGERAPASAPDPRDPDLVAYWNFDEGRGWRVRDVTGRGHDLIAAETPRWEVVRWLSVCGNGLLEGLEECDDGNPGGGDGCSAECKVEPGWSCTKTSPSVCTLGGGGAQPVDPHSRPGGGGGDPPFYPPAAPPSEGPKAGGASKGGGHGGWAVAILVLGVVGAAVAGVVAQRERIYDRFPQVERAVHAVASRLPGRRRTSDFSDDLYRDFRDGASSDFTQLRPPPSRGTYLPLPEAAAPAPPPAVSMGQP